MRNCYRTGASGRLRSTALDGYTRSPQLYTAEAAILSVSKGGPGPLQQLTGRLNPQARHPALGPNTPCVGDKQVGNALNIALIILLPKFPKTKQVSPHLFLPFAHSIKHKQMYHTSSLLSPRQSCTVHDPSSSALQPKCPS